MGLQDTLGGPDSDPRRRHPGRARTAVRDAYRRLMDAVDPAIHPGTRHETAAH
jgi:hypothetical protein